MNIFVGNLSYNTNEEQLRQLFEQYGTVDSARIIMDRETHRSRGFGFVEMPDNSQAQAAIQALEGHDLEGRPLRVNEARPREDRGRDRRPSRY